MAILNHGHTMNSHSHKISDASTPVIYGVTIPGKDINGTNVGTDNQAQGGTEIDLRDGVKLSDRNTGSATSTMSNTSVIGPNNAYISSTETRPFNFGVNWILKY